MSTSGIEAVKRELGAAAPKLPDLSPVPEASLREFAETLATSRQHQRALLEQSAEHSLRLVPALLRPVVRKVLFGG